MLSFKKYDLEAILRSTNRFFDVMDSIGILILDIHIDIVHIHQSSLEIDGVEHTFLDITMEDKNLWYIQLVKFLGDGIMPINLTKASRK